MSEHNPHVVEATAETFERDAIERSAEVPVVVDFWAQWCGPCRVLGPTLERLASEYAGQFVLVKVDTESASAIAAEFGVRSIPTVFGLRDGKVVDGFVGAYPENEIRAFLDRLLPTPADRLVAEAKSLEESDLGSAEAKYLEALALTPDHPAAKAGLGRVLFARGMDEEARGLVADLERRGFLEPEAEALKAELTLRDQAKGAGDVGEARRAVAEAPGDLDRRLKLAEALAASGVYEEALEIGLDFVERDRKGVGESARKMMVAVFQVLPPDSDLVSDVRRRLSFVL